MIRSNHTKTPSQSLCGGKTGPYPAIYALEHVSERIEAEFGRLMLVDARRCKHVAKLPRKAEVTSRVPVNQNKILAALKKYGPMTTKDMIRVTGIKQTSVICSLRPLKGRGQIKNIGGGRFSKYALVNDGIHNEPHQKISASDIAKIKADDRVGRIVAEEYGISSSHVSRIRREERG